MVARLICVLLAFHPQCILHISSLPPCIYQALTEFFPASCAEHPGCIIKEREREIERERFKLEYPGANFWLCFYYLTEHLAEDGHSYSPGLLFLISPPSLSLSLSGLHSTGRLAGIVSNYHQWGAGPIKKNTNGKKQLKMCSVAP